MAYGRLSEGVSQQRSASERGVAGRLVFHRQRPDREAAARAPEQSVHVTCPSLHRTATVASTARGFARFCVSGFAVIRIVRSAEGFGLYGRYLRAGGQREDCLTV